MVPRIRRQIVERETPTSAARRDGPSNEKYGMCKRTECKRFRMGVVETAMPGCEGSDAAVESGCGDKAVMALS